MKLIQLLTAVEDGGYDLMLVNVEHGKYNVIGS